MALECVICLENFKEDDIVLSLPCDHDFHVACMYAPLSFRDVILTISTPWLTTQHRLCPLCKRDIIHGHEVANELSPLLHGFD